MKISEAVEYFGSKQAMAKALGVQMQTVYGYVRNDKITDAAQNRIELITDGALKADNPPSWKLTANNKKSYTITTNIEHLELLYRAGQGSKAKGLVRMLEHAAANGLINSEAHNEATN